MKYDHSASHQEYRIAPVELQNGRGGKQGHAVSLNIEGGRGFWFHFPRRAALMMACHLVLSVVWLPVLKLWWWRWGTISVEGTDHVPEGTEP